MIEKLLTLIEPSAGRIDNRFAWEHAEAKHNTRFPGDYKELIDVYGAGRFSNVLMVFDPFEDESGTDALTIWNSDFQDLVENSFVSDEVQELGPNVLIFGTDEFNGWLGWLMAGEPDGWCVVALDIHLCSIEVFENTGVAEFLYKFMTGELTIEGFAEDCAVPSFVPY